MRLEYFHLIDRILEFDPAGRTIRAQAVVPMESPVFEGHFPDYPLMPGVMLIETMAQASGWLIIGLTGFTRMPFLAALKEAKLRSFVTPGQTLTVSASLIHEGSGYTVTKSEIAIEGKRVCNAEITFRVVDFPSPKFRADMQKIAVAIALPMGTHANV
jgi:3-hydroxyacyl-[acyl-carrier-protein] dehydratase